MQASESAIGATMDLSAIEEGYNCCGACKNKSNSLNAHCGKQYTIDALLNKPGSTDNFNLPDGELDSLIGHIYKEHHQYYYSQHPLLMGMITGQSDVQGMVTGILNGLGVLYQELRNEVTALFLLEESLLFPYIKGMIIAERDLIFFSHPDVKSIDVPARVMMYEHEAIERILKKISLVTGNYIPVENASGKTSLLFRELKALHDNLVQHIFIEKDILYPRAVELEAKLKKLVLM